MTRGGEDGSDSDTPPLIHQPSRWRPTPPSHRRKPSSAPRHHQNKPWPHPSPPSNSPIAAPRSRTMNSRELPMLCLQKWPPRSAIPNPINDLDTENQDPIRCHRPATPHSWNPWKRKEKDKGRREMERNRWGCWVSSERGRRGEFLVREGDVFLIKLLICIFSLAVNFVSMLHSLSAKPFKNTVVSYGRFAILAYRDRIC